MKFETFVFKEFSMGYRRKLGWQIIYLTILENGSHYHFLRLNLEKHNDMKWIKRFFEFWLIFIMTGISASLVLVITLIAITVVNTHWKTDRFRFENFETAEELIEYIKTNYPNGSDGTPLIALLDDAGAKCELIPEKYYSKKDKELGTYSLYQCFYGAGWLYWPTLIGYGVWLSLDENQKLMDFSANREWNGF